MSVTIRNLIVHGSSDHFRGDLEVFMDIIIFFLKKTVKQDLHFQYLLFKNIV